MKDGKRFIEPPARRPALVTIREALGLLSPSERRWSVILMGLMMLTAILESAVVAMVLPLVYAMVDPNQLEKVSVVRNILGSVDLRTSSVLPVLLIALAVLLILATALSALTLYLSEAFAERSRNRLAHELLEKIIQAPYSWILRQNTAVLAKAVFDDVRIWRRDCVQSCLVILQGATLIIFPATVAVSIAPGRGFLALLVVGAIGAATIALVRRPMQNLSANVRINHNRMMVTLSQVLQGMREVKVSNRTTCFLASFDKLHALLNHEALKARLLGNLPASLLGLSGQLAFVLIALILWQSGLSGIEITAQIALIGVVVSRVLPAVNRINAALSSLLRSLPYVEGLLTLLREVRADNSWLSRTERKALALPRDWQQVQLVNVCMTYPNGNTVLKDISITFERGKRYGIVGRSGAGKSTLVNIFLGLLAPTDGTVLIDGKSRDLFRARDWLEVLAYVPQDVFILDDTLRANICFGSENHVDEARFDNALELACLKTLTDDLAEGREVHLGERGRRFSGGQAQRVAIARALYRAPSILLLDETTSALDAVTEASIHKNISHLDRPILTIAVSHRLSSLRDYDAIIVLDDGQVADTGTYSELLERSQIFRDLAARSKSGVTP